MTNTLIKRHWPGARFIHWFNAVCWFFLLATGLGLIDNPALQPLGPWWPAMMRSVFGGGANLLVAHWSAGVVWSGVWLIFILIGMFRYTLPFMASMVRINPGRDIQWMIKKNIQMTLGYKMMARLVKPLGWDGRIPDQGFYNVGQKAAAVPIILGGIVLAATGFIMLGSKYWFVQAQNGLVQWSITLHYLAAGVTFAILLIHIYMAGISKEERPALFSMFTGTVPEEYARHHHRLWYEKVNK